MILLNNYHLGHPKSKFLQQLAEAEEQVSRVDKIGEEARLLVEQITKLV